MSSPNKPLFSVIVPVYNVADYLAQCVDSVLSQNFHNFELIIIDDGSTDQSSQICDNYAQIDSRIKVLHQKNSGLSAARNAGIKIARGNYLLFLDGDDYFAPNALRIIESHLEPNLDLLRFQAQEVFADQEPIRYSETSFSTTPGISAFPKLAHYHYLENAWLYAYRRDFFQSHHFQYADSRLSEDFGLTPLVIASATSVKSISDICYSYRQRSGSIMRDPARTARRLDDMLIQLRQLKPKLSELPGTAPILHFLVVSLLSNATALTLSDFQKFYLRAKQSGLLRYVRPTSLRSLPRSFTLKHFPRLFYKIYQITH